MLKEGLAEKQIKTSTYVQWQKIRCLTNKLMKMESAIMLSDKPAIAQSLPCILARRWIPGLARKPHYHGVCE